MTQAGIIVEIDQAELACRIVEAISQMTRPPGLSAKQALETQDKQFQEDVLRAANAATVYLKECCEKGAQIQ